MEPFLREKELDGHFTSVLNCLLLFIKFPGNDLHLSLLTSSSVSFITLSSRFTHL